MKKLLTVFLAVLLAMTLTACSSGSSASEAKSYTAIAQGINGDVKVTVTFEDSKITKIETEHKETDSLGGAAITKLTDEVIDNQSVNVDMVSGATVSSTAFLTAVKDCIKQAGLNEEDFMGAVEAEVEPVDVTDADLIVVGAGGAGMTAAYEAYQNGLSVIILEKSGILGGNTPCAVAGVNAYDSDVQLADETYKAADTSREGFIALHKNELNRDNLLEAFAGNSGAMVNLYSSLGVNFTVEISEDDRNSDANYYMLKSGDATSTVMINAISTALESTDVKIYKNMEATSLVETDGKVTGVKATYADGNEYTFTGKAVLLATGGYGKNHELVAKYNPDLLYAVTDETAPTTGDGILMAEAVGAKTVDMDQIQTFPVVIDGYGMITPNNLPGGFPLNGTIYVNNSGNRFGAEQFEMLSILQEDNGECFAIFGEDNMNGNNKLASLESLGYVVSADTAEELAEKLGINAENLKNAIDTWNADAETGTDSVYGRTEITPISGKLYGYKFGVGAHYCRGGILINELTQVLDTNETPIEGLYAAGETTGGFHGAQRVDGSGTSDAFTFGYIAGNTIADYVKGN